MLGPKDITTPCRERTVLPKAHKEFGRGSPEGETFPKSFPLWPPEAFPRGLAPAPVVRYKS
jgi:hypothetical protein